MHARNATAADLDRAAERWARAFWLWLLCAGAVHWLFGLWWPTPFYVLAVFSFAMFCGASVFAHKLRVGTYPIPNSNNGLAEGNAENPR